MAKKQLGSEVNVFENKMKEWETISMNEDASHEQVVNAMKETLDALQTKVANDVRKQAQQEIADNQILSNRGQNILTAEEKEFFNALSAGFADKKILPESTVNRVFDDLVKAHPLLEAIGIQNLGAVTKFIYSNPTKTFAWKDLFEGITGQANATFTEESFTQLKLTSLVVVPNDMIDLGPEWIERYVRTLLTETLASGLEYGFVKGRGAGQKEPVGLMKNVDPSTSAVTDKASSGTLTFAPSPYGEIVAGELYNVVAALSVDSAGKAVDVSGKVVMVVNPQDAIAVSFRNTIQTANGAWVTALPYNIQLVQSTEIPVNKALFFVKGRYLAATAGASELRKFDQTFAIDDATLYTIKQFANGKPKDNKAALVYDLDITFDPTPSN